MTKQQAQHAKKAFREGIDKIIYLVGFFSIVVYLPQIVKVWTERTAIGLSLPTWIGMSIGSVIWMLYGIAHRQKPLIFINLIIVILQIGIVIGILLYS